MPDSSLAHTALHQLRFVFERSAPLLRFVPDMTSGDIARIWSEIADRCGEPPVAIDVTFAPAQAAGAAPDPKR
ncbi:MAG: hypothetical protein WCP77_08460 [Roseococcus sp.]